MANERAFLESCLCTFDQFETQWYGHWCGELREVLLPHRKQWEFCFVSQALFERGMIGPGKRGLGFGVGREPLPALYAKYGCSIVATDQAESSAIATGWMQPHQGTDILSSLNVRGICAEDPFRRLVSYRATDMNHVPEDLVDFDFVWSSCSFEHLGSIQNGLDFVVRAMDCLRPGGVAVHTTEFNVSSNSNTFISETCVLFRRRDIEELVGTLTALGHTVAGVNYDPGSTPSDQYVDLPPYRSFPHLKVQLGQYVTTSIGLIITKAC